MAKALFSLVAMAYPFIVYCSLDRVRPRYFGLLMAALFLMRWKGQGSLSQGGIMVLAPASVVFFLAVGLANDDILLLAYPVFVNALLFLVFFLSYLRPPSIVEKLARLRKPDLPPKAVAYTLKATLAWCLFFAGNGMAAAATLWWGDRWLWSLYNGFLAYLLMAAFAGAEWVVRKRFKKRHGLEYAEK